MQTPRLVLRRRHESDVDPMAATNSHPCERPVRVR